MLISNYEGLPVSIIEALSVGLPIVASDVGGVSELVIEGVNGVLVPKKDSLVLSKILIGLATGSDYDLVSMGRKSREMFEESFNVSIMAKKTENLIYEILQKDKKLY